MAEKTSNSKPTDRWADGAVVYQIYPRSFQDSNGDGIGDLAGITSRLDYLAELGVNAIWLSPFYPSPMADFGYDVADYCDVDPSFGTLADFDAMLKACAKRHIKVIIDLVPNHSSDEHPWFVASRKSRDNPYADWYVWRDPLPGSTPEKPIPPNNWLDVLSGNSTWEWDEGRKQFYLHSFHIKQPDLNWSNPDVREAIKDAMRFWLERGVDGFRVDAVYWMAKEPMLSDDAPNPDYDADEDVPYDKLLHRNSRGWPVVYAYLAEMARVLQEPAYAGKKRFMVTEAYPEGHNPIADYMEFYVGMDPEVAAPFNFEGLSLPWQAEAWRRFLKPFHHALSQFSYHCVASYAFGNHDQSRVVSRLGERAARSAACLQLMLPGMIFVYNGDELGMRDVDIPPESVRDPAAYGGHGRDPERTPMQWSDDVNAGFSTANPWLPVAPDYASHNVETERENPQSFLNLYKQLIKLRTTEKAISLGEFELIETPAHDVLAFRRHMPGHNSYVVIINFSEEPVSIPTPAKLEKLVISSAGQTAKTEMPDLEVALAAHEAVVYLASDHLTS
jgi:alpha-glucosidase